MIASLLSRLALGALWGRVKGLAGANPRATAAGGIVLAIALALLLAYCSGARHGAAKGKAALAASNASVKVLQGAVDAQNASIAAQGKMAAAVAVASQKAIRSGAAHRAAMDAAAGQLVQNMHTLPACGAVPNDVRQLWEAM